MHLHILHCLASFQSSRASQLARIFAKLVTDQCNAHVGRMCKLLLVKAVIARARRYDSYQIGRVMLATSCCSAVEQISAVDILALMP